MGNNYETRIPRNTQDPLGDWGVISARKDWNVIVLNMLKYQFSTIQRIFAIKRKVRVNK